MNKSLKQIRSLITQSYLKLSSEEKKYVSIRHVNKIGKKKLIKLYANIKILEDKNNE